MSPRFSIFVCIVAALALTGCGRRGPLEPPPGALDPGTYRLLTAARLGTPRLLDNIALTVPD